MANKRKNYDAAVIMYNGGLSIGDVALAHGVTRQAMWKILRRRGVVFRPHLRFAEDNHFYREGIPHDARVHAITTTAIQNGILVAEPCECCGFVGAMADGRNAVEAHHDDYNKPFAVRWLCKPCHYKWHESNNPIRRTIELPVATREEICAAGGKASWKNRRRASQQLGEAREVKARKKKAETAGQVVA